MQSKTGKLRVLFPILLLLLAAMLRAFPYMAHFSWHFRTDDFGPLIYPARLAGYDWSSYVSGTSHYYGFGYYWIFAPLFKLIASPRRLLFAIAMANSAVMIVSSLLVYHLLIRYFSFPHAWYTVLFAIVPTMFQGDVTCRGNFWLRTDNEIPLYIVCWLLVWVLLAAAERMKKEEKGSIVHAACAALILIWGLTVHERALALLLAASFTVILVFLLKRKWLLQPVIFYGLLVVGFLGQRLLRTRIVRAFWQGGWPEKNTSAFSGVSLWFLKSMTAAKAFLLIFFGNLHSFLIRGFGLPAIALVILIWWIIFHLRKKKTDGDRERAAEIDPCAFLLMVFGGCFVVILLGLAVRWGAMLYPGLAEGTVVRGFKGICYSRYYYTFLGPLVFAVFVLVRNLAKRRREKADGSGEAQVLRTFAEASWGLFCAVELVFFVFVFPYCVRADMMAETNYIKRSLGTYVLPVSNNEYRMAATLFFSLMTMLLATLSLCRRKDRKTLHRLPASAGIVLFLFLVFFADRAVQIEAPFPSISFSSGERVAKVLTKLKKKDALPENVYVAPADWGFIVQFVGRDLELHAGEPGEAHLGEENLVVSAPEKAVYPENGYERKKIGKFRFYTNCQNTVRELVQ